MPPITSYPLSVKPFTAENLSLVELGKDEEI